MSVAKFRSDRNYLLRYFVWSAIIFGAANVVLVIGAGAKPAFAFHPALLLFVPAGILLGLIAATAFHNASHGNLRPKFLNVLIGELTGAFNLEGMRAFRVGHQLHHRHTDDAEKDPHPPGQQTFGQFLWGSRDRTIKCLSLEYFTHHGHDASSSGNVRRQVIAFKASAVLKVAFWFLLLGPAAFVFFFIPSYLAYFLGFGHLNYISHLPDADGVVRIKNHHHGIFFRVMNLITSGGYFHKNHHRAPWLYNPSTLQA